MAKSKRTTGQTMMLSITQKTTDRATQTQLETGGKLRSPVR